MSENNVPAPFAKRVGHAGGPTCDLDEKVAALIRENPPATAARLAVRVVEAAVERRYSTEAETLRLDRDALTAALSALCDAVRSKRRAAITQAALDAVELLSNLPRDAA